MVLRRRSDGKRIVRVVLAGSRGHHAVHDGRGDPVLVRVREMKAEVEV